MIKQNFKKQLQALQLTNSQLIDKLSDIINANFNVDKSDAVQNQLTSAHADAWRSGKAYPTSPIITEALSILLTGNKNNYATLVLSTPTDAEEILVEALTVYNRKVIADFDNFKLNCTNGYFDRIKLNPFSSKVTAKDIMRCIAYLVIQGYLYSTINKPKKLDLTLYSNITDVNHMLKLINSNYLLVQLRKYINSGVKLTHAGLFKGALMDLLVSIKNQEFFN